MSEPGEIPTPEEAKAETPPVAAVREAVEETQKQQMEKVLVHVPMPGEKPDGTKKGEKISAYKAWSEAFNKVQKAVEAGGGKVALKEKIEMQLYAVGRHINAGIKDLFWNVVNFPKYALAKFISFGLRIGKPFTGKFFGKAAEVVIGGGGAALEKMRWGLDPRSYRQQEIAQARKHLKENTGERPGYEKITNAMLRKVGFKK